MGGSVTVLTSKKSSQMDRAKIRELCKLDLFALSRTILFRDAAIPMTTTFHKPICEWFARNDATPMRLVLTARDTYKTGCWNAARNVQRILNNPQIRILITSNKGENAEGMLAELKACLNNDLLIWAFPDILCKDPERNAPRWTTGQITVKRPRSTREATVETTGMEAEITSRHFDHITHDDLVGERNSMTREMVLGTIEWFKKAQGLTQPWTTQDVLGTMWHYADLYCWLIERAKKGEIDLAIYKRACWEDPDGTVPARRGPQTKATFPERWPLEALERIRKVEGSSVFAAQRLLDPVDDETAVFVRSKATIVRRNEVPPLEDLWLVMAVDPATSQKAWADYSAIAVVGFDRASRMHVLDLKRDRWTEAQLMAEMFASYHRYPMIRAIGFETTAFQKIYRLLLTSEGEKRGQYLPVVKLERDTKVTKSTRILSLQPYWESGDMLLCDDLDALEDFLDEASRFRRNKESTHDDMLDALADTLQLRVQPEEQRQVPIIEDAELAERAQLEDAINEDRVRRGLSPLETASMREAVRMQRRRDIYAAEQAMATSQSEFSG